MNRQSSFTRSLNLQYPIVQAPMAGGPTTVDLVCAVSNAGGLGTLAAGYLSPEDMLQAIRDIRHRIDKPFGVNLLIPPPIEQDEEAFGVLTQMNEHLNLYRSTLGLPDSPARFPQLPDTEAQIEVCLQERVDVFSFTFSPIGAQLVKEFHHCGTTVVGTATNVREALILQSDGVDAIVAQGSEAGGHRGTFTPNGRGALIGTMALVPQMVDAVKIPVIAAGGIMDGRGLAASMMLGAAAVQMGTAFLQCPESGTHPLHRQAIFDATEEDIDVSIAFSGRAARGIRNQFMEDFAKMSDSEVPLYPIQNALTSDIRKAAAKKGRHDYMSMWAGQGVRLARQRSAEEVIRQTMEEAERVIKSVGN